MSPTKPTVRITYTRGKTAESWHDVNAVICSSERVLAVWGEVTTPTFPRSAFKPFQALALITSGAAAAYDLQPHQLALAMASHSGEPRHTEAVMHWLGALDLTEDALHCGTHAPMGAKASADLYRAGAAPSARHHNCSGKHTGMLTLMRHLGGGADYEDYEHPVQVAIRAVANRFLDHDIAGADWAPDGCAVPNYALSLTDLALAYARLIAPPDDLAAAVARLLDAWAARPDLVAGAERFDTAMMLATQGAVLSKTGAEGVQAAIIPAQGIGIAVKAVDGGQRAAEQVMAALLMQRGVVAADDPTLAKHWPAVARTVRNARGDLVGAVMIDGI